VIFVSILGCDAHEWILAEIYWR